MLRRLYLFTFIVLVLTNVQAQEYELTVSPNKCVALRKGQLCYQTLRLRFNAIIEGDYCLKANNQEKPLKCWFSIKSAQYRYALASSEAIDFQVFNSNKRPVAAAKVNIAWVYKQSRSRNRWRLF